MGNPSPEAPEWRAGQVVAEPRAIATGTPAPVAGATVAAVGTGPRRAGVDPCRRFVRGVLSTLGRAYPLLSGCGLLANSGLFRWAAGGGPAIAEVRLRNGATLYVVLGDYVGRAAYFFRDLDPKVTGICRRVLRPGDTFVDIGANCGLVTFYAATAVGGQGQVHAFEPQPDLVELLRRSAAGNGYQQVRVHPVALSDRDDVMTLAIPADNAGAASLVRRERPFARLLEVPVRQAGPYLAGLGLGPVRLMKIDVEGHEPAVLHGALEFLRDSPPAAIIFESNDHRVPVARRREMTLLQALAYQIYSVERSWLGLSLQPLDACGDGHGAHDYLAIHRGGAGPDIARRVGVTWRD